MRNRERPAGTSHIAQGHAMTEEVERSLVDRIVLRRLSLALDAADAGAWEWRFGMPSLRASGFARLLGAVADEAVTVETWTQALHPEDHERFWSSHEQAITRGTPWVCLHRVVLSDGRVRWLDARAEPIRADGGIVGFVGICVDVTDRERRAQRTREAARVAHAVSETAAILTALGDETLVIAEACERALATFECDEAFYWTCGAGGQPTFEQSFPPGGFGALTAETIERASPRADPATGAIVMPAAELGMRSTWALIAPVTIAGASAGCLALGWKSEREGIDLTALPDPAWLAALDRYCANIAIALVIARRQRAGDERDRLARRLQVGLMPTLTHLSVTQETGELSLQTAYRSGEERLMLGGDFLDITRHQDGGVSFVIGDVCGHGPAEAALGMILRSAWVGMSAAGERHPAQWVSTLNSVLVDRREHDVTFVTLLTGTIDAAGRHIHLALAGHPPPLLMTGNQMSVLDAGAGPALGLASTKEVDAVTIALPEHFALLAVTDGLFEELAPDGQRLGYDGLADLAFRADFHQPHALRDFVSMIRTRHSGRLSDDAAALVITRT